MPRMTDVRSVAANATVENILSGKLHEFLSSPSRIRVASVASAAGLRISILLGNYVAVQDQELSDANVFPRFPDDIVAEAAGFRSDRLVIQLRNTTAGAITARSVVDIFPR